MTGPDDAPAGRVVLLRHGQTEWSRTGRHTGLTDLPLLADGVEDARAAGALLSGWRFALTLASPLERARHTAQLAGFEPEVDADLREWDYGGYEGLTTAEIRARLGHPWTVFEDGVVPGATPGETLEEVAARTSRVIARILPVLREGDVLLVGHGHCLRILAATWLREQPRLAARLMLGAGALCVLGHEHGRAAIRAWNVTAAGTLAP